MSMTCMFLIFNNVVSQYLYMNEIMIFFVKMLRTLYGLRSDEELVLEVSHKLITHLDHGSIYKVHSVQI